MNPTRTFTGSDRLRLIYQIPPYASEPAYGAEYEALISGVWTQAGLINLAYNGIGTFSRARIKCDVGGHCHIYARDGVPNTTEIIGAINNFNSSFSMSVNQDEITFLDDIPGTPGRWIDFIPANPYTGIKFQEGVTNVLFVKSTPPAAPPSYYTYTQFRFYFYIYPVITVDLFA